MIAFVLLSGLLLSHEATQQYQFEVSAGSALQLETHKGHVEIRRHSKPQITVHVRKWDNYEGETLDQVTVNVTQHGNQVTAEVDYRDADFSGIWQKRDTESPFVDFTIFVPDDCDLTVEDHKSDLDIEATTGRMRLDTHKGEGRIFNVEGPLTLDTHKGVIEVSFVVFKGAQVDTHKGKVTLKTGRLADVDIWAETHKGDIIFQGTDLKMQRNDDHEMVLQRKLGAGTWPLRIDTHKGEVTIDAR
ncbi:MAG: DUF4097 family beta strand repeat protein [Acidobacteria bacterium]|nr:DUF4097 family beta strand repeat protein [Acidobacteriota bacterium]